MITYSIGILSFIPEIHTAHPHVTQPWYTDNAVAVGKFASLHDYIQDMVVRRPTQGYFLDLTKSILVISMQNFLSIDEYFRGVRVRLVTGSCNLGGFFGDPVTGK